MGDTTSTEERAQGAVRALNGILKIDSPSLYEERVKSVYRFPINPPLEKLKDQFGISVNFNGGKDENGFDLTLKMRRRLKEVLNAKPINKGELAKWIVEVWGGITPGKANETASPDKGSLMTVIEKAEDVDYPKDQTFDFYRIASWSKYLAFKTPEVYAIYDARVIYSLNWLLYKSDAQPYFPFPAGRNSVMGLLNYELYLFLKNPESTKLAKSELEEDITTRRKDENKNSIKKSSFVRKLKNKLSGLFIDDDRAFAEYCCLLESMAKRLFGKETGDRLTKTEMLLFSIADAEIAKSVLDYVTEQITKAANGST
jgi:hypothetical protein